MPPRIQQASVAALALMISCTPAERRTAGEGVAVLGLATTSVGAYLIDPCLVTHHDPALHTPDPCRAAQPSRGLDAELGARVAFIGLSTMVLGGILYGFGLTGAHTPAPNTPGSGVTTEEWLPTLDRDQACDLAEGYVLSERFTGPRNADTQPTLECVGSLREVSDRAELTGVNSVSPDADAPMGLIVCFRRTDRWFVEGASTVSCGLE